MSNIKTFVGLRFKSQDENCYIATKHIAGKPHHFFLSTKIANMVMENGNFDFHAAYKVVCIQKKVGIYEVTFVSKVPITRILMPQKNKTSGVFSGIRVVLTQAYEGIDSSQELFGLEFTLRGDSNELKARLELISSRVYDCVNNRGIGLLNFLTSEEAITFLRKYKDLVNTLCSEWNIDKIFTPEGWQKWIHGSVIISAKEQEIVPNNILTEEEYEDASPVTKKFLKTFDT